MGTHLRCVLVCASVLSACSAPSLEYSGQPPTRVDVGHRTFDVYVRNGKAEAIRTNHEWGATKDDVFRDARTAIEEASRCTVDDKSISGDVALISAKIRCEGRSAKQ
jgi:hypothetical protein